MMNKNKALAAIAVVGLLFAGASMAASNSPYAGIQLGYGNLHPYGNSDFDGGVFAGRVNAGYQFNKNFAIEAGYSHYTDYSENRTSYKISLDGNALDLVAKGILPVADGFNVFGTLGAAYIKETVTVKMFGQSFNDDEDQVVPTFGAGVSYDINSNLSTELVWSHLQKVNDKLSNTDFFGLGLTYHFG